MFPLLKVNGWPVVILIRELGAFGRFAAPRHSLRNQYVVLLSDVNSLLEIGV